MDYSSIARSIEKTIAKGNKPLTDSQFMLMTGALAIYLDKVYTEGYNDGTQDSFEFASLKQQQ